VKVYISGLISNGGTLSPSEVEANRRLFFEAEEVLLKVGCEAYNPAREPPVEGWVWGDYMRRDLPRLFACDAIIMLPGWEDSPGAILEHDNAVALDMVVLTYEGGEIFFEGERLPSGPVLPSLAVAQAQIEAQTHWGPGKSGALDQTETVATSSESDCPAR
jgi:hypothetical protein